MASETTPAKIESPPGTEVRKRSQKADVVKKRVIRAALEAFAIHGFEGTKLKDVAEAAGISLPLLVYHFESKENLWEISLKQAAGQFDDTIKKLNEADIDNMQRLRKLVVNLVTICSEFPEFHRIMAMESYQLSERLVFLCKQCARHHHQSMIEIIAEAQQENPSMAQISPERLCFVMVSMARMSNNAAGYEYLSGAKQNTLGTEENIINDIFDLLRILPKPPVH